MEAEKDKRYYKRLPVELGVLCHKVAGPMRKVYTGSTVDVSAGGILFKCKMSGLKEGDLVSLDMSIPPDQDLLRYGGRFSTYARVVRISAELDSPATKTLALEFCDSPRLMVP